MANVCFPWNWESGAAPSAYDLTEITQRPMDQYYRGLHEGMQNCTVPLDGPAGYRGVHFVKTPQPSVTIENCYAAQLGSGLSQNYTFAIDHEGMTNQQPSVDFEDCCALEKLYSRSSGLGCDLFNDDSRPDSIPPSGKPFLLPERGRIRRFLSSFFGFMVRA